MTHRCARRTVRAISVPLAPVIKGQQRSLTSTPTQVSARDGRDPYASRAENVASMFARAMEPAVVLELRRDFVLPWIDPAPFQFLEPAIPLRCGQPLPTPRTEADPEARCATVMDDQPVLLEPGAEPNHCVWAVERVIVVIAVPVHLARHRFAAVLGHGHQFRVTRSMSTVVSLQWARTNR